MYPWQLANSDYHQHCPTGQIDQWKQDIVQRERGAGQKSAKGDLDAKRASGVICFWFNLIKLHLAMFIADCLLLTTYIAQISIKKPDLWCKNKMINSMNDILFFCWRQAKPNNIALVHSFIRRNTPKKVDPEVCSYSFLVYLRQARCTRGMARKKSCPVVRN